MTNEEIVSSNKLIAEFMGIQLLEKEVEYRSYNSSNEYYWETGKATVLCDKDGQYLEDSEGESIGWYDELPYEGDWNWLMPVVEKICSLDVHVSITEEGCDIIEKLLCGNKSSCISCHSLSDKGISTIMEATYNSVIGFIKWYNNEQEKTK